MHRNRILLAALFALGGFLSGILRSASAEGEPPVYTLEGVLSVIYADHPDFPQVRFVLHTFDGDSIVLSAVEEAVIQRAGGILALQGQSVTVTVNVPEGDTLAGRQRPVTAVEIQIHAKRDAPHRLDTLAGERTWVNLLCKFPDVPSEPFDAAEAQSWFASESPFLNAYWQETSFGNLSVSAVTSPEWLTLPHTLAEYLPLPNDGYIEALFDDCTALHSESFTYSDYFGINLIFNTRIDGYYYGASCHFVVLQGVEQCWRPTWIPFHGEVNLHAIAHEMGHNFGLPHSTNSDNDGWPYENLYDIMSGYACRVDLGFYGCQEQHTIAPYKIQLGWLSGARVVEFTAPGTYPIDLDSITLFTPEHPQTVVIPITPDTFFTVEARRNDLGDFDETLDASGVVIHEVDLTRLDPAWQVNASSDSNSTSGSGIFLPGETYVNAVHDFSIHVEAATLTGYAITVQKGGLPVLPDLALTLLESQLANGRQNFSVRVANNGSVMAHDVSFGQYGGSLLTTSMVYTDTCGSTGVFNDFCFLGDLAPGESVDVTFSTYPTRITAQSGELKVIANEVESSLTNADNILPISLPAMTRRPDFIIDVVSDKTEVFEGESLQHTVRMRNFGGVQATNVALNVTLPDGVQLDSWDWSVVGAVGTATAPNCTFSGSTLTCTMTPFGLMQHRHSTFTLNLMTTPQTSGDKTITAAVTLTQVDADPADNTAAHTFAVMLPGDANGDNAVTIADFSILAATFGKRSTDAGYDARADFNDDDAITIADFSILAAHFGQTGG